jgi:CRP-like cAMP-binding protein
VPLLREGEHSDHALVILDGRAKIVSAGADGTEALLAFCGPGDLVGELSALHVGVRPRVAAVVALEPVTAQVIPRHELLDFLESHPRVAVALLRTLACKLLVSDRRRIEFGNYDAAHRLARVLVEMAEERVGGEEVNGPVVVAQGVTQSELAGMVSASRESVGRALAALRADGMVTTARRTITVTDLQALRRFAL